MKSRDFKGFQEIQQDFHKNNRILHVKSCWILLNLVKSCESVGFMKSCEILWIYEIQQISVQIWTSGGFQIMQISFRFTADFSVDYIMDFIVDFMDFIWNPLDSIWKTRRNLKSDGFHWNSVDFMKSSRFHTEISQISLKSADFTLCNKMRFRAITKYRSFVIKTKDQSVSLWSYTQ